VPGPLGAWPRNRLRFGVEDPDDAAADPHEADERRRRVVAAVMQLRYGVNASTGSSEGPHEQGADMARPSGFPVARLDDAPVYRGDITKRLDR
jgi:hypothetical protein